MRYRTAKQLLFLLSVGNVAGCEGPNAPEPAYLKDVTLNVDPGIFSRDYNFLNNEFSITDVHLTIVINKEDDTKQSFDRHWSEWKKGEYKTINAPAAIYQSILIKWKGRLPDREAHIYLSYRLD